MTTTPCYFGGKRYWFTCPLTNNGVYCGRRVATIYLHDGWFGCRHCHNLTYESRNECGRQDMRMLGKLYNREKRAECLYQSIKRKQYAGKPTKKMRILSRLTSTSEDYQDLLYQLETKLYTHS